MSISTGFIFACVDLQDKSDLWTHLENKEEMESLKNLPSVDDIGIVNSVPVVRLEKLDER